MNTINKIALVQVCFAIGDVILFTIFDYELRNIIINHIILTIGYLYGFWHNSIKY